MRRYLTILVVTLLAVAVPAAAAEKVKKKSNLRINEGAVTLITDGVTETSGLVSELASTLAETVDVEGKVRLLPVMGYGATTSVRDLLYLRGIDLGILNSDILAYLRLQQQLPAAQSRVRYVARLLDKTVYLVARPEIGLLADLAGKEVLVLGKESEGHVTARTIAGLAGIDMRIAFTDWDGATTKLETGEAAALVVLDRNPVMLMNRLGGQPGLRLVPIPLQGKLAEVYERKSLTASEAPGMIPGDGLETIKVSTVLAVYAWRKEHNRYGFVNGFVRQLFAAASAIRSSGRDTVWNEVDLAAPVPGWKRYEPAEALLPTIAAPVAAVPTASDVTSGAAEEVTAALVAPTEPAPPASDAQPIALVGTAFGPLSGESEPQGGILTQLLTAGLRERGLDPTKPGMVRLSWSADRAALLKTLLSDGAQDAGFPAERPDCTAPAAPADAAVAGCDQFLFSEAVFQVLNGLFIRTEGEFQFASDADVTSRVICAAAGADIAPLDADGRNWVKEEKITLLRQPTLDDCLRDVAKGDADAAFGDEFTGREALARLGLSGQVDLADRPVATTSLHAVVAKSHPRAAEIVATIDQGLRALKAKGLYSEIVTKRLAALWGGVGSTN